MRVVVRGLAGLISAVVAAVGVVLVVEVAGLWLRPQAEGVLIPWRAGAAWLAHAAWNGTVLRAVAAGVGVLGLILVVTGLLARRRVLRLHDPAGAVTVTTSPRSVARLVAHRVRAQDGVRSATVTARRRRIRVRATGHPQSLASLRGSLQQAVTDVVTDLPLRTPPRVSVSVSASRERA